MTPITKTTTDLATLLQGEVEGDQNRKISGVASLFEAEAGDVSFLGHQRYFEQAQVSRAGAILLALDAPRPNDHATLIRVKNPSKAFALVCGLFQPPAPTFPSGVAPGAWVDPGAQVDPTASIQPGAVIESGATVGAHAVIGANAYVGHDASIGAGSHLYPNCVVRERCLLGERVVVHSGVVIGSDGFGFDITSPTNEKIPQIGIVRIGNDVEIGANTCIDRARFGQTVIGNGVKIDNLVQIAHNVVIGDNSIVVALTGIAGSTIIGKRVILAGQVGLAGHTHVGDGAILTAKSGVSKDVPPGAVVSGVHALPIKEEMRLQASLRQVPELIKRVRALEKALAERGPAPL